MKGVAIADVPADPPPDPEASTTTPRAAPGNQRYGAQKAATPVLAELLRLSPSLPQGLIGECQVRQALFLPTINAT